jgi:SAM-dependent methyltransferase
MMLKRIQLGYCPICSKKTVFYAKDYWLRGSYRCLHCKSIPRQRAIMKTLIEEEPRYKEKTIHESSASGPTFNLLKRECFQYTTSYYFPKITLGHKFRNGTSCENLEKLTLPNDSIDIFITQDVFEHINYAEAAFKEIARVLKPGGKLIFTVPLYPFFKTRKRIDIIGEKIVYILPPQYHGNPIDKKGSLVTYDWGNDISEYIEKWTGMKTKIIDYQQNQQNSYLGLEAEFLQVLVSIK